MSKGFFPFIVVMISITYFIEIFELKYINLVEFLRDFDQEFPFYIWEHVHFKWVLQVESLNKGMETALICTFSQCMWYFR